MQVGDCVYMKSCTIVSSDGDLSLTYKAPKGERFMFMLLGADAKDNTAPLDPVAVMNALGWTDSSEEVLDGMP